MKISSHASQLSGCLLAGALSLAMSAPANAITYILDYNNIGYTSTGTDFAYVTIEEDEDDIKFSIDANDDLFNWLGNPGIQAFGFNCDNGCQTLTGFDITFPGTYTTGWDFTFNKNMDGQGKFDVVVSDSGSDRHDPLEFWVTGVTGDTVANYTLAAENDSAWFSVHIMDFESGIYESVELTSAFFAGGDGPTPPSEIPVPAAVWLFGSGLLGLVGVARRRKS